MAHGTPDWGVTAGAVTTYQLTDLAEHAVRLGSIVTHDRRGDVIWLDSFEDGLEKWTAVLEGTGAVADLSTAHSQNGRLSARLVAGSDGAAAASLNRWEVIPVLGKLGFEFRFRLAGTTSWVGSAMTIQTGSDVLYPKVRWVDADNTLQYFGSSGLWTDLASGVSLSVRHTLFHVIKLVVDAVAKEYVRLIVDSVEYPMSGIAVRELTSTLAPELLLDIENNGRDGQNDTVYIENPILTQNEPA